MIETYLFDNTPWEFWDILDLNSICFSVEIVMISSSALFPLSSLCCFLEDWTIKINIHKIITPFTVYTAVLSLSKQRTETESIWEQMTVFELKRDEWINENQKNMGWKSCQDCRVAV